MRVKLSEETVVRQILEESDDDFSSLSELDDSHEDGHYAPNEFEISSSLEKIMYNI